MSAARGWKYMKEINIVHQNICGPGRVIDDTPTSIQYSTVQRLSNKPSISFPLDNIIGISKLSDTLYWFQLTDVTFMKFTAGLTTEFVSVYNVNTLKLPDTNLTQLSLSNR